jgi:hypothetical protein
MKFRTIGYLQMHFFKPSSIYPVLHLHSVNTNSRLSSKEQLLQSSILVPIHVEHEKWQTLGSSPKYYY